MTYKLQRHGNDAALIFDEAMLAALNATVDTPIRITVQEGTIVITPVQDGVGAEELDAKIARLRPSYEKMLQNLAKQER